MRLCRAVRRTIALGVLGMLAACAGPTIDEDRGPDVAEVQPLPVPQSAARDINADGFVDASEAAGFFARRFGDLDQDGDARLSREEMALDLDQLDDPDGTFEALDLDANLLISQDEYFQASSRRFRQRVNPTSGMMSSADFDTMIRSKDPLLSDQVADDVRDEDL